MHGYLGRMAPPSRGSGLPHLYDGPTVRRFAASGIIAAHAISTVVDLVLGFIWIGYKTAALPAAEIQEYTTCNVYQEGHLGRVPTAKRHPQYTTRNVYPGGHLGRLLQRALRTSRGYPSAVERNATTGAIHGRRVPGRMRSIRSVPSFLQPASCRPTSPFRPVAQRKEQRRLMRQPWCFA